MISSSQIRAARALLRWSSQDLADTSGIGVATIKRMEVMNGIPSGQVRTLAAIKECFEGAGVEFVGDPEVDPGVRLMRKAKSL